MSESTIKTIVFDWGDTVMRVFPDEIGPMLHWKKVEMIPHAPETLSQLSKQYQLVLATNAEDSTATEIRLALARVGLDPYFDRIYTHHELGKKKPEPQFFTSLENKLNRSPRELLMVGNDYQKDILPAWNVGWNTGWFNPHNQIAKAHLPVQDYECVNLIDLPKQLQQSKLPNIQTCLTWYSQQEITHALIEHVQTVGAAAYQLAVWFRKSIPDISPLLAHRGGLLHDLAKLIETRDKNHAVLAEELLIEYHQPVLGKIAGRHLMGDLNNENRRPVTWEEKLVHYADKLAEGNNLVSLSDRLAALKNRYPSYANKIDQQRPLIETLENEICTTLSTTPEKLLKDLQKALFDGDRYIS